MKREFPARKKNCPQRYRDQRPGSFDDDARYKIRTKATVSFVNPDRLGNPWAINPDLASKPKDYAFRRFCSDGTLNPDPAHS
ncbi:hypothetical protein [Saccharopolyspora shandongensis]|uniref:hypothetical protein n=1 Tax=Saccharopolyspora shandongensis TaxID=418495 RepID=UPI0033D0CEA1